MAELRPLAEARAALERLIGTDGVPLNALFELPAHDDVAGWEKIKAAVDTNYARMLAAAADVPTAAIATTRLEGALVHFATPAAPIAADAIYLELHGGALVLGGGDACRHGARVQADQLGLTVWSIDYRLAPEHRYPATLDDCLAAYRAALERRPAHRIVVGDARRAAIWRPRCCCAPEKRASRCPPRWCCCRPRST